MSTRAFVQRHPLTTYFGIAFLISWGSGLVMLAAKFVQEGSTHSPDALLLFPILVVGVGLTGTILTGLAGGSRGLGDLFARIRRWQVGAVWYAVALLIPPGLIMIVLLTLHTLASSEFVPNFFLLGILFGLFPGFFEEIGWMGWAFPQMQSKHSTLTASITLGVLWWLWHMPVVDSLGAASPHGAYWFPFFLAFGAVLTAMRVLIAWVYANTQSLLLTQLMHASSTGSLVILSPSHLSPAQETLWYAVYAGALWLAVAIVTGIYGKRLV